MNPSGQMKKKLREKIWNLLEERGMSRFPWPILNRIPNFKGSEIAAEKLTSSREFLRAKVLKVNPDAPQRPVRFIALRMGKQVLMPTPRLRDGFILLDPDLIDSSDHRKAASIAGAFSHGIKVDLDNIPKIDMVIMGSVCVTKDGGRLGKGEGYAEIEFAVLRELGRVGEKTPISTTVHDLQIVEKIPHEVHDVSLDTIFTPTQEIVTQTKYSRPKGIIWELLADQRLEEMPILKRLRH